MTAARGGWGMPFLRWALTNLTPPALAALVRAAAAARRTYPSFEAAARASRSTYAAERLSRFRVERARLGIGSPSGARLPPAYAYLLLAVHMSRSAEPRVVDLGGGCGEWAYALRHDAVRRFRYTVVEHEDLARRCSAEPSFDWARWVSRMPRACDVFLASGTLQYLADPYAALAAGLACAREAVVLGRNSFSERPVYSVQRSVLADHGAGARWPAGFGPGEVVEFPHQTLSYERVRAAAERAGWTVRLECESTSAILHERPGVFGRDLLLVRRSAARRGGRGA